jgi:uncharacterized membrane protein
MASTSSLRTAGLLLGIALGGFIDGILFHQVLQWHHLLSAVDDPAVQDIRVQIFADGAFHLLMYALAVAGLAMLWRARGPFGERAGGALPWAWLVLGFGAWHVADVVLFHWVLRLHHVRMDAAQPIAWDIGVGLVGVAILLLGWRLLRSVPHIAGGGPGSRAALSIAVLAAGIVAALPMRDAGDDVLVVFAPSTRPAWAWDALAKADARVSWVDASGTVWAVRLPQREEADALYGAGAWWVGTSRIAAGCLGWSRVR